MYIFSFDPWKSPICTCPPKYSLNPYTGCGHRCIYCYATTFIKNFYTPRPKKDFEKVVRREISKLPPGSIVSLSNSSDPYQPLEKEFKLTRKFLEIVREKGNIKILIITKSDLVIRDLDILKEIPCAVTITITSRNSQILEPQAPQYESRLKALRILSEEGIPVATRLDPLIPGINDEEILEILENIYPFVKHVTVSTYKARHDSLRRLIEVFPSKRDLLVKLYLKEGKRIGNAIYLREEIRNDIITKIAEKAKKLNLSLATCREGLTTLESKGLCDGSFLIP